MNSIYALLSHSWSGLVIAAVVGLIGFVITRFKRWRIVRWFGFAVCALALVMAVASGIAAYRISRAQNAYPPMGKLVDVGGYRLHILAEGDAKGGPTLVWIPGGHGAGLAMYHLHKAMRGETRSILFDRPGTGWSDTGPFPITTKREAVQRNESQHKTISGFTTSTGARMNRRDFIHGATLTAANLTIKAQTASRAFQSGYVGKSRVYYEVHGDPKGKPFFLGYPIMASYGEIFGDKMAPIKTTYLNGLTDRYRVLLVDYPTIGKSGTTPVTELTADRVCADLLSVADAAEFKKQAGACRNWPTVIPASCSIRQRSCLRCAHFSIRQSKAFIRLFLERKNSCNGEIFYNKRRLVSRASRRALRNRAATSF